jgi:hypothetical protein
MTIVRVGSLLARSLLVFDPADGRGVLLLKYEYFVTQAQRMYRASQSVLLGRAIPQAVSRRLPTAAVRVQTRVW